MYLTWTLAAFGAVLCVARISSWALGCTGAPLPARAPTPDRANPSTGELLCRVLQVQRPSRRAVVGLTVAVAWGWYRLDGVNPAAGVVLGGFLLAVPVVVRRLAAEPELPGPAAVILLTEQLAARLSSGGSLLQALESVDPRRRSLTADLERLRAHVRRGASLQRELDTWAAGADVRLGVPLLVDALALAGSTGGSQACALERVAATLRDRQALSQEIDAQASLAKASAAVLVVLPVAFSALLCIMDSQVRHSFTSVIGAACLVAGTAADLVGARWMRRIIRSAS